MFGGQRNFQPLFLEEGEEYLAGCECTLAWSHPLVFDGGRVQETAAAAASADCRANRECLLNALSLSTRQLQLSGQSEQGRLRICSKSLVFDAFRSETDVVKLPFRKIQCMQLLPPISPPTALGASTGASSGDKVNLLISVSEFVRVPLTLAEGRTRCVCPYTVESALAASQELVRNSSFSNIQAGGATTRPCGVVYCFLLSFANSASSEPSPSQGGMMPSGQSETVGFASPLNSPLLLLLFNLLRLSVARPALKRFPAASARLPLKWTCDPVDDEFPREDLVEPLQSVEAFVQEQMQRLSKHLRFNFSQLNPREQLLLPTSRGFWVRKAKPLTSQRCLLLLTTQCMYVQQATNGSIGKAAKCYPLKFLRFVFRRTRCLRPGALELIFAHLEERDPATEGGASGGLRKKRVKTLLLDFDDLREREEVACALHKFLPQVFAAQNSPEFLACMRRRWVEGRLSSFHYLQFLNAVAGRSTADLGRYPVFPWVLLNEFQEGSFPARPCEERERLGDVGLSAKSLRCSYSPEDTRDPLQNPAALRDLSKPVGALNPQRLESLVKRMQDAQGDGSSCASAGCPPNCGCLFYLYGSHYSTPAFVVHLLVRRLPECLLRLHGGKFDCVHRLFKSMEGACKGSLSGQSSFVELTPEFYGYDAGFLCDRLGIRLTPQPAGAPLFPSPLSAESVGEERVSGVVPLRRPHSTETQKEAEGQAVVRLGNVELPGWAAGDPSLFLLLQRRALESKLCSGNLHRWIDLVFGCRQTGQEARRAHNCFHPLTYADAIAAAATGSAVAGAAQRRTFPLGLASLLQQMLPLALQVQLQEFGQTPIQLFAEPHPMRLVSPPFSASAWETSTGKRVPSWLMETNVSSSAEEAAMWSDAPWFVYVHRNPHLLRGLLTATPLPRQVGEASAPEVEEAASSSGPAESAADILAALVRSEPSLPPPWNAPPGPDEEARHLLSMLLSRPADATGRTLRSNAACVEDSKSLAAAAGERPRQLTNSASRGGGLQGLQGLQGFQGLRAWSSRGLSAADSPWQRLVSGMKAESSSWTSAASFSRPTAPRRVSLRVRWKGLSGLSCHRGVCAVAGLDGSLCCFDGFEALHAAPLDAPQQTSSQRPILVSRDLSSTASFKISSKPIRAVCHLGSSRAVALGGDDGSVFLQRTSQPSLLESSHAASTETAGEGGEEGGFFSNWSFFSAPKSGGADSSRGLRRSGGHLDSVLSLAFDAREAALVSGAADSTGRLWSVSEGGDLFLQRECDEPQSPVVAVAAGAPFFLLATEGGALFLYDSRTPLPVWQGQAPVDAPVAAASLVDRGIATFFRTPQSRSAALAARRRASQALLRGTPSEGKQQRPLPGAPAWTTAAPGMARAPLLPFWPSPLDDFASQAAAEEGAGSGDASNGGGGLFAVCRNWSAAGGGTFAFEDRETTDSPSPLPLQQQVFPADPNAVSAASDALCPVCVWDIRAGGAALPGRRASEHAFLSKAQQQGSKAGLTATCGCLDTCGIAVLAGVHHPQLPQQTEKTEKEAFLSVVDCLERQELARVSLQTVRAPEFICVWPQAPLGSDAVADGKETLVVAVADAFGAVELLFV